MRQLNLWRCATTLTVNGWLDTSIATQQLKRFIQKVLLDEVTDRSNRCLDVIQTHLALFCPVIPSALFTWFNFLFLSCRGKRDRVILLLCFLQFYIYGFRASTCFSLPTLFTACTQHSVFWYYLHAIFIAPLGCLFESYKLWNKAESVSIWNEAQNGEALL